MITLNNKRIWIAAIMVSLFLHGVLIFCLPSLQKKKDPVLMTVRFTTLPAPAKKPPPVKEPEVKKKVVKQKIVKKPSPPKPKPKPEPKPLPEEKPIKAVETEMSKTPIETTLPTETTDSSASSPTDSTSHESTAANSTEASPAETNDNVPVDAFTLRITKKVIPEYSSFSRKRREEGTVKIIITIDNGKVIKAELEQSSEYVRLDESALRAVKQWTFDYKGRIRARLPIVFKLQ